MDLKKELVMKETLNRTKKYPFTLDELFFIFHEEALLIYKDPWDAALIASDTLSEFIKIYGNTIVIEESSTQKLKLTRVEGTL